MLNELNRRRVERWAVAAVAAMLLVPSLASPVRAADEAADQFANPIDVFCADPFIFKAADRTYYLYGTSAPDGLLVWTSRDLVNWQLRGHAFKRSGETWANRDFWAPELFEHHGKFYLHFTAVGGEAGSRRLVLTESDSPLGPFKEIKAPWFDPGKQTIDGHVFRDTDGQLYLYSVQLGKPFQILVRKLDAATLAPS